MPFSCSSVHSDSGLYPLSTAQGTCLINDSSSVPSSPFQPSSFLPALKNGQLSAKQKEKKQNNDYLSRICFLSHHLLFHPNAEQEIKRAVKAYNLTWDK
jgi:hypothetical protein